MIGIRTSQPYLSILQLQNDDLKAQIKGLNKSQSFLETVLLGGPNESIFPTSFLSQPYNFSKYSDYSYLLNCQISLLRQFVIFDNRPIIIKRLDERILELIISLRNNLDEANILLLNVLLNLKKEYFTNLYKKINKVIRTIIIKIYTGSKIFKQSYLRKANRSHLKALSNCDDDSESNVRFSNTTSQSKFKLISHEKNRKTILYRKTG